jgi:hypothetical protein
MNSQEMKTYKHNPGGWRVAGCLVIALALGGWLAGPAFAQQEEASASETSNPAAKAASATKTSKPAAEATSSATEASKPAERSSRSTTNQDFPQMKGELTEPPPGITVGNYNIKSSIDLGWRYHDTTGSEINYDTMVNLHQGVRLFDFSFDAHSINHAGAMFDTLTVNGFGFGGDPDDVVRMRMSKNKWYNFDANYRRDKYFWDYNLLANPLNPTNTVVPAGVVNFSPHALDLSRRMTSLNLTLLPQSIVTVRLGYAHENLQGPSFSSDHVGTEALLFQDWKNTTDIYHVGVDFHVLARTTFSYDQFVQHFKQDTSYADVLQVLPTVYFDANGFIYQLGDGTPVDAGLTANPSPGSSSCLVSGTTTPPTFSPTCSGFTNYTRVGRPRATMPTERFSFQSTYIQNFTTTGQISYSSVDNTMADYNELFTGYESRTMATGSNVLGKTFAKRVLVNGDWSGIYQVTSKFRILDTFSYNTWRIPGQFNFMNEYLFPTNLTSGMLGQTGQFDPTATPDPCPPPFTAPTCPFHNASSEADVALGTDFTYLGQEIASNTFQLAYDFTPKIGANVGYRYIKRKVYDFSSTSFAAETFFPGGTFTVQNPSNRAQTQTYTGGGAAARGDCSIGYISSLGPGAVIETIPVNLLPKNCTLQSDGSVVFDGSSGDEAHNLAADINGNSALFGLWIRPASNFRAGVNVDLFSADQAYTRITPRLLRHYTINAAYTPVRWAEITGDVDIVDSSDNVTYVNDVEHNRSYAISTVFTPSSRFSFDISYNYNDIYTQALDCWTATDPNFPAGTFGTCPPILQSPVGLGGLSTYLSKSNFAYADMMVRPIKQLTFDLGYAGSFVRGTTSWTNLSTMQSVAFLNPYTPSGPLRFNYQLPYIRMTYDVYRGLSYVATWNYYGYNSRGDNNPVGLIPLGTQDFNGNNMTMSAKYTF